MNKKKRYNILLLGNYDGTNVGDDCILLQVLDKFGKDSKRILVPSRNPDFIAKKYSVNSVSLSTFAFISNFLTCDVFLIGGGGIFSGYVGPYAMFLPLFALVAKLLGKKVIYYNIGVYETAPLFVRVLVKLSMLFSDKISVRDYASFKTIEFLGRVKPIRIVPDPGLTLKPIREVKARELLRKEGVFVSNFLVGISAKYTVEEHVNKKIISEFSKFITWLIKEFDATVIFFPFSFNSLRVIENDLHLAMKLKNFLEIKANDKFKIVKTWNYLPSEVKGMVGMMNFFVGMRFHSIVFAYSMGVPLIGVSYEEKCRDFLESRCLPFIKAEEVSFDILRRLFLSSVVSD